MATIQSKILNMKTLLYEWIKMVEEIIGLLKNLADELDKVYKGVKISKVAGSSVAIGGGILAGVGFALSFVTFGTSLALSIAGGVIAGAGGLTTGIAQIVDAVRSSSSYKKAKEALQRYSTHTEAVIKECCEISEELQLHEEFDKEFEEWKTFWEKLIGVGLAGKSLSLNVIGVSVKGGLSIAKGIQMGGAEAGVTAFKTLGSTAGKALHCIGGVAGLVFIPFDIAILVDSAMDIHKGNPNKASLRIRAATDRLQDDCPTEEYIDRLITVTLERLQMVNHEANFHAQ